eukprot:10844300-Alexandrium_andersonii.AAC.1
MLTCVGRQLGPASFSCPQALTPEWFRLRVGGPIWGRGRRARQLSSASGAAAMGVKGRGKSSAA